MASAESLAVELRQRGYLCAIDYTVDGPACVIYRGPGGAFTPPAEVLENGGFHWKDAGGRDHREALETSDTALAEAVLTSIEIINPA